MLFDLETLNNPIESEPADSPGENAAAKAINDAGGVNGHMIKIVTCNGAGDPNKAAACARKAVSDHVTAVTGMGDPFSEADVAIIAAAKIPMVGISGNGDPIDFTSPYAYPLEGGATFEVLAGPFAAAELKATRYASFVVDFPSAIQDAKLVEKVAPSGITYVGTVKEPETGVTDYTPYAAQLAGLHPDAVGSIASPGGVAGIIKAARAQGLNSVKWTLTGQSTTEEINNSLGHALDDTYYLSAFEPPRDTSVPYVAQYDKDVQAYTGKSIDQDTSLYSTHGINAWMSVYAVAKVAASISGDVTTASLVSALNAAPSTDIFGWTFNPNGSHVNGYPRVTNGLMHVSYMNKQGKLVPTTLPAIDLGVKLGTSG